LVTIAENLRKSGRGSEKVIASRVVGHWSDQLYRHPDTGSPSTLLVTIVAFDTLNDPFIARL